MENIDKEAMKRAGMIGGIASLILALSSCIVTACLCFLPAAVGLGAGAYYVSLAKKNGTISLNLQNAAIGGAATGVFVGAGAALGGVLSVVLAVITNMAWATMNGDVGSAALIGGTGFLESFGYITSGLISGILWAGVGAAAYAWYLNRDNPVTPTAPPAM
jgi:hypothetical protein